MFDLQSYLRELIAGCASLFGERLLYVGLQGSHCRGEANTDSDIDVMLVIDRLSVNDMDAYRDLLGRLGQPEKACGFICGKDELARWNPLEICQLRHTTKDLLGTLAAYLPPATRADEINYVKVGLGNFYHEICHRYVHADRAKNVSRFRGSCKMLFFLIQNLHFLESGRFVRTQKELRERVAPADREALTLAGLPDDYDFDAAFAAAFRWCGAAFARVAALR